MKTSALPILAVATVALSTAGCSWMGGQHNQPAAAQTSMAQQQAGRMAQAAPPPALAPDFVREIQNSLNSQGYNVSVDGVYGATTQSAVQQFQQRHNLMANGQVDASTLAALGLNPANVAAAGGPGYQQQPGQAQAASRAEVAQQQENAGQQQEYTPTARRGGGRAIAEAGGASSKQKIAPATMRDIQQSLKERGYKVGAVDGKWGPHTRTALRDFQRDEHLRASGRIDERTLAALGIGARGQQQTGQLPPERQAAPPRSGQMPQRQMPANPPPPNREPPR